MARGRGHGHGRQGAGRGQVTPPPEVLDSVAGEGSHAGSEEEVASVVQHGEVQGS